MSEEAKIRHTFLGMPGYGSVTADAARGFWRASRNGTRVNYMHFQGSLLAQGFNALWCAALNSQHKGETVDYFAMQHADIEPEDGWLDKLTDEMEANDLDIIGAVAPIKDFKGMTSIAVAHPTDTWRVKCRLSLKEIYRLPETFTSADVGGDLLLNTGLWVCRFDPRWNKEVHFTVNDRIVYESNLGIYMAQVEPEDWYFSRLCHELGLKVGCTRKVLLNHKGQHSFTNAKPWGIDYDDVYLTESSIPVKQEFQFPHDVDGWLTEAEGKQLFELAKGKHVLEIGSYCGRSTICLAQNALDVVSIDPHDGRGTGAPRNTLDTFRTNLYRYAIDNVRSSDGTDLSIEPTFDLVFIDGSHEFKDVKNDIERSMALLKDDGLIVFHDYHRDCDPDVTKAVDEFLSAGAELLMVTDTLAVVKPSAAFPLEV
jgi:protein-L-isoaspartate O-methyltransferase